MTDLKLCFISRTAVDAKPIWISPVDYKTNDALLLALFKHFGVTDENDFYVSATRYDGQFVNTVKKFGWDNVMCNPNWEALVCDIDNIRAWMKLNDNDRLLVDAFLSYTIPHDTVKDTVKDAHSSLVGIYDSIEEYGKYIAAICYNIDYSERIANYIDFKKLGEDSIQLNDIIICGKYYFGR